MFTGFEGVLSAPVTTVGVVVLFMLALMTGVVTPGKAAQKRVDDAVKRADDWRTLYEASQAENQVLRAQTLALAQGSPTAHNGSGQPPESVSAL